MGRLYDAWMGVEGKNVEKILALVTDDFIFEWHSSGKLMGKRLRGCEHADDG